MKFCKLFSETNVNPKRKKWREENAIEEKKKNDKREEAKHTSVNQLGNGVTIMPFDCSKNIETAIAEMRKTISSIQSQLLKSTEKLVSPFCAVNKFFLFFFQNDAFWCRLGPFHVPRDLGIFILQQYFTQILSPVKFCLNLYCHVPILKQ